MVEDWACVRGWEMHATICDHAAACDHAGGVNAADKVTAGPVQF